MRNLVFVIMVFGIILFECKNKENEVNAEKREGKIDYIPNNQLDFSGKYYYRDEKGHPDGNVVFLFYKHGDKYNVHWYNAGAKGKQFNLMDIRCTQGKKICDIWVKEENKIYFTFKQVENETYIISYLDKEFLEGFPNVGKDKFTKNYKPEAWEIIEFE